MVQHKKILDISPVTRLEGHLDFRVELEGSKVISSWSSGALIRGFEVMLQGRDPLDALVMVPRICGVCPTSHQLSAVKALDQLSNAQIPPNAHLVRSILQALETIYSHAAQFYVLFGPDLVNEKYTSSSLKKEVDRRFAPLSGSSYLNAVEAKRLLNGIYAILGGQYPHCNVFVPGGVTCSPDLSDLVKIKDILAQVVEMVETMALGCSLQRWLENRSLQDVLNWLEEKEEHRNSDLGLFIRYGQEIGLQNVGAGPGTFIAYPYLEDGSGTPLFKGGFVSPEGAIPLEHEEISEQVRYSWAADYQGGRHPFQGETRIELTEEGGKYSYLKSLRYGNDPAEAGPLARMLADGDPLVKDLGDKLGVSVFTRMLARLHEMVRLIVSAGEMVDQLNLKEPFYEKPAKLKDGKAVGLNEAPRGAIGHWVIVENGKLANYQIVTPTAWNASPRGEDEQGGPIEQAVLGVELENEENPVELQHVIRSFDPCLACAVHLVQGDWSFKKQIV